MSQKDDHAEKDRRSDEYPAQDLRVPKGKSHQKWQACVSGKKEISPIGKLTQKFYRLDNDMCGKWPDMRKGDEDSTNDVEEADAFYYERHLVDI